MPITSGHVVQGNNCTKAPLILCLQRRLSQLSAGIEIICMENPVDLYCYNDKKTFTINEKKKDLGLLKKVQKLERSSLETRHEHSISVPHSTSLNHCITDKTLQHLFILISSLIKE